MQDQIQYIEFGIADERYAIPIREIQEIIRLQPLTPIPNTKKEIQGVINLRGKVVPVVCFRKKIMMQGATDEQLKRIIILNTGEDSVGLIVDRVYRVASYYNTQPTPDGSNEQRHITGIGQTGPNEQPVAIIAVDALL
ncbi:chemotaxis protein CheW [Paenibacillus cremeus]|uniref:Chemotaxis protein CheW n=1 Tax=Paenibacillus cremeus TaxID=2163881 RepID=A0A559KD34_9BACL|nr:chemotaxis protein CheW [Paenibacillus cremeus]TVY10048.1 chemotaxis protein CheW [Paenibacillus cremeus]